MNEYLPDLVLMLACGIGAVSVLTCAIVSLVRDLWNDRVTLRKRASRRSLRVVRR